MGFCKALCRFFGFPVEFPVKSWFPYTRIQFDFIELDPPNKQVDVLLTVHSKFRDFVNLQIRKGTYYPITPESLPVRCQEKGQGSSPLGRNSFIYLAWELPGDFWRGRSRL